MIHSALNSAIRGGISGLALDRLAKASAPSFVLDFLPGILDPRITFARASSGTHWGSDGLLKTATSNAPRFDFDPVTLQPNGLLIEPQRTNLLLNSLTLQSQTVSVAAAAHVLSFYGAGSVALSGAFTGTLNGTGLARSVLKFTPTAGDLALAVTGDVWLGQMEAGSFVSSPIVTAGSQVTRAADVPILPLAGASWLSSGADGTFIFELDTSNSDGYSNWWDASPTSSQFSMRHAAKNTYEGSIFGVWVNGAVPGITGAGGRIKAAVSFTSTEAVLVINGVVVATPAMVNSTVFTATALHLGKAQWGVSAGQINDHYRALSYMPKRTDNAALQSMTAP